MDDKPAYRAWFQSIADPSERYGLDEIVYRASDGSLLDSYRDEFARRNQRWRARVGRTLKRGMSTGEIRKLDPQQVSVIFHEMQSALLTTAAFKGSSPGYDWKKVNLAIDILLRGIVRPAGRRSRQAH